MGQTKKEGGELIGNAMRLKVQEYALHLRQMRWTKDCHNIIHRAHDSRLNTEAE